MGNKVDYNSHIGISITSTITSIYGRLIRYLIEQECKNYEEEERCGFRAVKYCTNGVLYLKYIIL